MKSQSFLRTTILALLLAPLVVPIFVAASASAQVSSPGITGAWRADVPLPNGVVQTFRFDPDGTFDLASALAVDGSYRVDGNQLIETVTLPTVGVTNTDTATFTILGDSLTVHERAGAPARVLHHSGRPAATSSIIGDWAILVSSGTAAHYVFGADGTMHVRAQVGDEHGKYTVRADTLHLSNDQTFQLPAIARFTVADSVLTLTPLNGKQPRQFHKVLAIP